MAKEFTMVTKPTPKKGMRRPKYPWDQISPGRPLKFKVDRVQAISSTAYSAARSLGVRFTLRKVADGVEVHLHEEAASKDQAGVSQAPEGNGRVQEDPS